MLLLIVIAISVSCPTRLNTISWIVVVIGLVWRAFRWLRIGKRVLCVWFSRYPVFLVDFMVASCFEKKLDKELDISKVGGYDVTSVEGWKVGMVMASSCSEVFHVVLDVASGLTHF